jgi:DNA-binding transcriptional MerR regulator
MTAGSARTKAPDAFRTIGEAADEVGVAAHVLRFWEGKFPGLKPMKRAGNRRYYRPADIALLKQIKRLLHEEGYTVKGAQKALRASTSSIAGLTDMEGDGTPTLFDQSPEPKPDLVPDVATAQVANGASDAVPGRLLSRLRQLSDAAEAMASECAIVAAGNSPPKGTD